MTNPDNVGGLLPCPFCGEPAEMTSRPGGQAVAFSEVYMANCSQCGVNHEIWEGEDEATARWNRRPELCRAAPAGGDVFSASELESLAQCVLASVTPGGFHIPEGWNVLLDKLTAMQAKASAPAGSGEVEALASRLVSMSNGLHSAHLCTDLRRAAALLRKLQQGADGWRPIESAPKDGSLFLCWVDAVRYGERDDGSFDTADCSDVDFCQWRDSEHGGYFMNMMGDIGDGQNIAHWRPLPNRPASQDQDGGRA